MGFANSAADPNSFKESAGVAPETGYSRRNERDINPAARFRSYEGMTRGESAPVYNYNNYNAGYNPGPQSAVTPIQTPVAPVAPQPVAPQPVAPQPVAPGSLPANFADALRPATPAEAAMYQEPQPPPMTPEQIQSTMNPLSGAGY